MIRRLPRRWRWLYLLPLAGLCVGWGLRPDETPFFAAVLRGDLAAVKRLARAGEDLFDRDGEGRSGLIVAVAYGKADVARYLLAHKADVDARDMSGATALHYAAQTGDLRMVQSLLAAKASPQAYDKHCHTPVEVAAGYAHDDAYHLLSQRLLSLPLPQDGTVEECHLTAYQEKPLAAAQLAFHRRLLKIDSVEDYPFALQSLDFLSRKPGVGTALLSEIAGVVDHPSPLGAEDEEESMNDAVVRTMAAKTLRRLAATPAETERIARRLLPAVASGGCVAYRAKSCSMVTCQEDEMAAWPRTPAAEACFNCAYCESTRIAHAFNAAYGWFKATPGQAARADAALAGLVKKGLLTPAQLRQLKRRAAR